MSETKRKNYTASFKAKVGLEAGSVLNLCILDQPTESDNVHQLHETSEG